MLVVGRRDTLRGADGVMFVFPPVGFSTGVCLLLLWGHYFSFIRSRILFRCPCGWWDPLFFRCTLGWPSFLCGSRRGRVITILRPIFRECGRARVWCRAVLSMLF